MRHLPRLFATKTLFAIALATLLFGSLSRYLGQNKYVQNVDFYVYYFAAQVIHDDPHANIYEGATDGNPQTRYVATGGELPAHARAAGFDSIQLYIYPPLLADTLAPFSGITPHHAVILWRAFNLALVLGSCMLLAGMLRVPIIGFEFVVLALAAYSFFPIHEAISLGQVTVVMLALWTVGILAYSEDRMFLSAAAFALATALKVTPILLVPLFFIWKDRRWIVSYIAVSLGLVGLMVAINGWHTVSVYPAVMSAMGGGMPSLQNKSIGSLLTWIYYRRIFTMDSAMEVIDTLPRGLMMVTKAASGIFYLYCLYLAWRSREIDRFSRAGVLAVFGVVTVCMSPVAWRHGYSVAFLALAIYWVKELRTPTRPLRSVLLALMTITLGCFFVDVIAQIHMPQLFKILIAGSWVIFSVPFCLDTLSYASADDHASTSKELDPAMVSAAASGA
jgi:hypothetical protein